MKYDDASWHSGGEFPPDSPEEFGGTHIALMLKWCFQKGWAGDLHTEDSADDLDRVLRGEMSATEYFFTYCDGKFTDEDLIAEGNAFMRHAYNAYLEDYGRQFGAQMYVVGEEGHDYEAFSRMIDDRYRAFAASPPAPERPRRWWSRVFSPQRRP